MNENEGQGLSIWDAIKANSQRRKLAQEQFKAASKEYKRRNDEYKKAVGRYLQETGRDPIFNKPAYDDLFENAKNDYLDDGGFNDAIMPQLGDPNLNAWAQRRVDRAQKEQDNQLGEHINLGKDYKQKVDDVAKSIVESENTSLFNLWDPDKVNDKLSSINWKILQNNTLGILDPKHSLSKKEVSEIVQYHALIDPVANKEVMDQFFEVSDQIKKDREAELRKLDLVERPEAYDALNKLETAVPLLTALPGGQGLALAAQVLNPLYEKSFASDFILKTNESQMEVPVGQISRSNELLALADATDEYMEVMKAYTTNLNEIFYYQNKMKALQNGEEPYLQSSVDFFNRTIGELLAKNQRYRKYLEDNKLYNKANDLASWAPVGLAGITAQKIDSIIDDDLGGIRGKLVWLGPKLDEYQQLLNERIHDKNWITKIDQLQKEILGITAEFRKATGKKQKDWQNQIEEDIQDINDWKSGNNWLGLHAEVDPYYQAQAKKLELTNFSWKDPQKLVGYGLSGIAGGSNSSWWKSGISIGSKVFGAIGGALTSGGTSTAIQFISFATSFEADKTAASEENNIESANKAANKLERQLKNEDLYDDFLTEGARQLGYNGKMAELLKNEKDAEKVKQFIMDAYLGGKWHSANPKVGKMYAESIIGLNNQFYLDQPVNTADAAIGSAVSIFNLTPIKYITKSVKVQGKLAEGLRFAGVKSAVGAGAARVSKTVKPVATKIDDLLIKGKVAASSTIGKAAKKANAPFIGVERRIARDMAASRAFASTIPSAWLKTKVVGKTALNVGIRTGVDTFSEMTQEGIQGLTQYNGDIVNDKIGSVAPNYDVQHNRSLWQRITEDVALGLDAWNMWIHQGDPDWASDADVVGSMNATPLLTIFGPNLAQVGVQAHNAVHQMSLIDLVKHQLQTTMRGDKASLQQMSKLAQHLSKEDYAEIMSLFDKLEKRAGKQESALSRANALNRLMNGANTALLEPGEKAIPSILISAQKADYEDLYNLANSNKASILAVRAGLLKAKKTDDDKIEIRKPLFSWGYNRKFADLVSMLKFRQDKLDVAAEELRDVDLRIQSIFGQPLTESEDYYEDDVTTNPLDVVKSLVRLRTVMRLASDYGLLSSKTARQNYFLLRMQNIEKEIKKQLAKRKIDIETIEDIESFLANDDTYGHIFRNLNTRGENEEKPFDEFLDEIERNQRDRELAEFNHIVQLGLLEDFLDKPNLQIEQWKKMQYEDETLEKALEEEWIKSIQRHEKALNREVKDGDVYVGHDGKFYITNIKRTKTGEKIIVKHRYNPITRKVDPTELRFDRVEYDESKTKLAAGEEQARINEKKNKNQASGAEPALVITPQSPDSTDEQPSTEYSDNQDVLVKVDDKFVPGKVIGNRSVLSPEDEVTVSVNGVPTTVKAGQISIAKPLNYKTSHSVGDRISVGQKNGEIVDKSISDVNPDTFEAAQVYSVRFDDGTVEQVNEVDIEPEIEDTADTTDEVEQTQQQKDSISALARYKEKTSRLIKKTKDGSRKYTTGRNYFIKVGTRFVQYLRVHGLIDDQFGSLFEESDEVKSRKTEIKKALSAAQLAANKKEYDRLLDQYQNEYNKQLAERLDHGTEDPYYERYAIDLSEYKKDQNFKNPDSATNVAEIVTSEIPGVAVVSGQIIDDISREFFANEGHLQYDPKYKMSEETFNSVVKQLTQLRNYLVNELHWVIDTTPYTWFGTMKNGKQVAGETDMIAIDQAGGIHVLDFKTTRSSNRFKELIDPETGEVRMSFFEDLATKDNQSGRRTYAAQYGLQLETYRLLIQQALPGAKVVSLDVIPFVLTYEDKNNIYLEKITKVKVEKPINLSNHPAVKPHLSDIDNYLNQTESIEEEFITDEDINRMQGEELDGIASAQEALGETNSLGVNVSVLRKIRVLRDKLYQLREDLGAINKKDQHLVEARQIEHENLLNELSALLDEAQEQHNKFVEDQDPVQDPSTEDWINEPIEDVVENEKAHWWQFNNLHSRAERILKMPHWLESIIKPDFIKNSVFEVRKLDTTKGLVLSEKERKQLQSDYENGVYEVSVAYYPLGQSAIKFKETVRIRLGNNVDEIDKAERNLENAGSDRLSTMAKNLIRQYKSLFESLNPGEIIVAKHVERTNGVLVYKDTEQNLLDTPFADTRTLLDLINGEESLIGLVDENGNVIEVDNFSARNVIFSREDDKDGNVQRQRYRAVPGTTKLVDGELYTSKSIPAGSVVFLHKFRNDEDPSGTVRSVPIVLKGRKLNKKDAKFIYYLLRDRGQFNKDARFIAKTKDGKTRNVIIAGLTNRKLLQMIIRFGGQAVHAGHEFVFNYAAYYTEDGQLRKDYNKVLITDLRADPKPIQDPNRPGIIIQDEKGNETVERLPTYHRPIIELDLRDKGDVSILVEILSKIDMHINQSGIMSTRLNSGEDSWFGALQEFFLNEDNADIVSLQLATNEQIEFDAEDAIPDPTNINKSLSGIAWMVKHGHATTNASHLENPLISIHELTKIKLGEREAEQKAEEKVAQATTTNAVENQPEPVQEPDLGTVDKEETKEAGQSEVEPTESDVYDELAQEFLGGSTEDDSYGQWVDQEAKTTTKENLRETPISKEEERKIEKRIKRLLGRMGIHWTDEAIEILKSGAVVAGRCAINGLYLSRKAPVGTEYHESFHKILELLTPERIRNKIYAEYRKLYGEAFKKANGRELTDTDISEGLAEMFRSFMISRDHVQWFKGYKPTFISAFKNIKAYVDGLNSLGSRNFAMFFALANSGVFRFRKPSQKNIERFINVLGGQSDMTIDGFVNGKETSANLSEFPAYGGKELFNSAIEAVVTSLMQGFSIDSIASNAANIQTKLSDIQTLNKRDEDTEHSSWFRILTGEYAKEGEQMTKSDLRVYLSFFRGRPENQALLAHLLRTDKELLELQKNDERLQKPETRQKVNARLFRAIHERENSKSFDQLSSSQKQMSQLFSPEAWPIVQQKIEQKLHKLGIDSQRIKEELDRDSKDNPEPGEMLDKESGTGGDIHDHMDESAYDHDRLDDATAAVTVFLSTVPDERFATEDDVKAGLVRSTTDKDGNPVTISNSRTLFGLNAFLPKKMVSNMLLIACHKVKTAEQLLQILTQLSSTHPIFYRIAKRYAAYFDKQILTHKDGKNRIRVNQREVPASKYEQRTGEDGVYYVWKDTGEKIKNAETIVNHDIESFITQLLTYLSTQRVDYVQTVFEQELDEDGNAKSDAYSVSVKPVDSSYGQSLYPPVWFARLANGVTGIFKFAKDKFKFTKDGKAILDKSISNLQGIYSHVVKNTPFEYNGTRLNISEKKDLNAIISIFVQSLNNLGIDITVDALIHHMRTTFKADENNLDVAFCFRKLIQSAKIGGFSFKKFLYQLQFMQKNLTEHGENTILSNSKKGDPDNSVMPSGAYMYIQNGFVQWLASAVHEYSKMKSKLMVNGPDGGLYTIAQSHTVSDITDDINETEMDKAGKIIKGRIIKDLAKYAYNTIVQTIQTAVGPIDNRIGSVIIKAALTPKSKINLVLHTHAGARMQDESTGGTKYNELSERDDWMSKAAFLINGGIIFPTLSDKSTYFYLTGVTLPGINYNNLDGIRYSQLLKLTTSGRRNEIHVSFGESGDFAQSNAQLDQMIEYAMCERAAIEKEINRKNKIPIIKNFHKNRMRFSGLVEIVVMDDNGNTKRISLNNLDKTPEECLKDADRYFFGDHITAAQRRKIMALTLEEGFLRNLAFLEKNGVITASGQLTEKVLDEQGNPKTDENGVEIIRKANRLFQYQNVGLDSKIIAAIASKYKEGNSQKKMSLAILTHVWDLYLKGVMSNEETERIYTGMPTFYKWKYGKIKNETTGKIENVLVDRHSDESKRLGGNGSTGERNRLDLADIARTYKCAEVKDQMVRSKLYDEYKTAVVDSTIRDAYYTMREQEIMDDESLTDEEREKQLEELNDKLYDEYLSVDDIYADLKKRDEQDGTTSNVALYNLAKEKGEKDAVSYWEDDEGSPAINVADGAAYITPELAKKLLRMRGFYTDDVAKAFDYLMAEHNGKRNDLRDKDAYRTIINALKEGSEKYSAYGYRMTEGEDAIPVHYYNKFALFVIFPQMASGFTSAVLSKMEEDGVEMLMMDSAVKTGSEEPADFNSDIITDSEQFKKFHFHTYDQDFSFIRRQLNTDPHHTDDSAISTQTAKIVLNNLNKYRSYKLPNGKKVRGKQLLQTITGAINALSDIGVKEVEEELFKPGTREVDPKKLSRFLARELNRRDADENLLDGIEIEEVDGEQRLKLPIEAMSSAEWIQSIISSKINKAVIDINVTGNAFYQRSVWGIEGKGTVLTQDSITKAGITINNGNDLLMINEEGSMDIVLSIDYFYDIIPKELHANPQKAKQWLIDHDIIDGVKTGTTVWNHTKAFIIGSRIPTQAKSSIHAFRVVDVLPIVKSTIVLPKEFTKTTGSDKYQCSNVKKFL